VPEALAADKKIAPRWSLMVSGDVEHGLEELLARCNAAGPRFPGDWRARCATARGLGPVVRALDGAIPAAWGRAGGQPRRPRAAPGRIVAAARAGRDPGPDFQAALAIDGNLRAYTREQALPRWPWRKANATLAPDGPRGT